MTEISELKDKIEKLINLFEEKKNENALLREENRLLKNEIESKKNEILDKNKQYNTLKIAKTLNASTSDKDEAKVKINHLVREIDKCISLLNR